ncbi:MAG: hypothetical protein DIU78_010520 [Pseudomonadota bacterium]
MLSPRVAACLGPALAARAERCLRSCPTLAEDFEEVVRRAEREGAGPEELSLALGIVLALRESSAEVS